MFLEKVCSVFSIHEGIEHPVGVGGQTVFGGSNASSPKIYTVWEGAFGVFRMTSGGIERLI